MPAILDHYTSFLGALRDANTKTAASTLLDAHSAGLRLSHLFDTVVCPALVEIGRLWYEGELSVAAEHLATQVALESTRLVAAQMTPNPPLEVRASVACVEGEQHALVAHLFALLLGLDGWDVDYLGAATPERDLVHFVAHRHPALVALSATAGPSREPLRRTARSVLELVPQPALLIAGAQAAEVHVPGAVRVQSLRAAVATARKVAGIASEDTTLERYLEELGLRVAELRKARAWSQKTLGEHADLDRTYISALERGRQNLTIGAVIKLAAAFGVPAGSLLAPPHLSRPSP